jgi:hypothetical protein
MSTWQVIIKNNSGITQIVEDLGISLHMMKLLVPMI